ncbi:hypothetical protein QFC22_004386 [Naganishia vaughanmartiniae]|uniref:Uncharacterized protein n=1 Tax=Naganishia vaughanmartiniae TaxID=1424756 RepID=A0ACC2X3A4_9TREE|nr:hypothetical protein QFC22_004386 [Naganishia vaughanmartiniae]
MMPVYQLYTGLKSLCAHPGPKKEGMTLKITGKAITQSMQLWVHELLEFLNDGKLEACAIQTRLAFDDIQDPFGLDVFLQSMFDIQAIILDRVVTEEQIRALPSEISLSSGT